MVHVTSEVGRLRRVLVHEPGAEVDRMVPAMMAELLFDDILHGERARDEHARFRRVLQLCGVEVIEANDLLAEALADPAARTWVIDELLADLEPVDREQLRAMDPPTLARSLVTGSQARAHPHGAEAEDLFTLPPIPNWCFQRDPQVILGDGVIFASMASAARHREAFLVRTIFRYHPELRSTPLLLDPLAGAASAALAHDRPCLEGGDVLVLSRDVVAVGISERTNRPGIRRLIRALARMGNGPRWLIGLSIPRRRAYMHLDTLITPVDRDACLVHAPVMLGGATEPVTVYEADLHAPSPSLQATNDLPLRRFAGRGVDLEPIPCGGTDPITQQREQWTDGANALAVAPGMITLYARNRATAETLAGHGFRIVEAEELLLGRSEIDVEQPRRTCILISSHEIARARGGPHCLTHPLQRDDPA